MLTECTVATKQNPESTLTAFKLVLDKNILSISTQSLRPAFKQFQNYTVCMT